MFFQHFIECIFHFNNYEKHEKYNKFSQSERSVRLPGERGERGRWPDPAHIFLVGSSLVWQGHARHPLMPMVLGTCL